MKKQAASAKPLGGGCKRRLVTGKSLHLAHRASQELLQSCDNMYECMGLNVNECACRGRDRSSEASNPRDFLAAASAVIALQSAT